MNSWVAIIITFCVILATFYFIKVLSKLSNVLGEFAELIETTREELKPAISGIRESVEEMKNITENIDKKLEKTDTLFEVIEKLSDDLQFPASLAGELTESSVVGISSLLYGIKKGIKTFYELNKKEEK